jgi:hypothetical protein
MKNLSPPTHIFISASSIGFVTGWVAMCKAAVIVRRMTKARQSSLLSFAIDGILTVGAFAIFFHLAGPHVPSEDPTEIAFWSAFCSACMTGVFWLAWQMLKVVYRHQRETAAAKH